ncbi:MAG: integrin alpha [Proteobacteria bacterium]|nr:integrin alpha [Pseudomonadota bacterium]
MSSKLTFLHLTVCFLTAIGLIIETASAQAQFLEPDVTVLNTFVAENPGDSFGWVGEVVGDLDRDRRPDYVIGAPSFGQDGSQRGRAYVYSGATGQLLYTHTGEPGDRIGYGIAAAGYVDRDRVPDYVISGPGVVNTAHPGRVLIVSGADHSILHDVSGQPGSLFGYDVNFAGDVNRDRHSDVIVGALFGGPGASGRVSIISGRDGSVLWSRDGSAPGVRFGSGVSAVGDLDGDRVPEQVVGAFADGDAGTGLAHVLAGDTGEIIFTLVPEQTAGTFGWFFAHAAGDVDRDRVPDIYVGDFGDSALGPWSGRAYVFSGATGQVIWTFEAENSGDGLGMGRGAGDVDRDRCDDILLGAYTNSDGAASAGKAYVVSGRDASVLRTFTGTTAGALLGFDVVTLGDVNRDRHTDYLITGSDVAHVVAGVDLRSHPRVGKRCKRGHEPRAWPIEP